MRNEACLDYQLVYLSKQETFHSWSLFLVASLFLLLALGFKIWIGQNITSLGYQLAQEREMAVDYDMQRRELELQLSVLSRPDNIAQRAQEVLGFGDMDPVRTRKITY